MRRGSLVLSLSAHFLLSACPGCGPISLDFFWRSPFPASDLAAGLFRRKPLLFALIFVMKLGPAVFVIVTWRGTSESLGRNSPTFWLGWEAGFRAGGANRFHSRHADYIMRSWQLCR